MRAGRYCGKYIWILTWDLHQVVCYYGIRYSFPLIPKYSQPCQLGRFSSVGNTPLSQYPRTLSSTLQHSFQRRLTNYIYLWLKRMESNHHHRINSSGHDPHGTLEYYHAFFSCGTYPSKLQP